ncbi:GAF domain-containing protein [Baaleninema sp.]|uniref:GAF domain-containing protein n=1 Tax=Baaleninema sp. TaxID=3101197 RepID=UPI003D07B437
MDYHDRSKEDCIAEIESLKQQLGDAEILQTVLDVQRRLMSSANATQQAATGHLMLKSMLLEVVQLFDRLTHADESSIFLLDEKGIVVESILARGATMRELKRHLIGEVVDKGLAGWVIRHRQVALIEDTKTDERWVTLPAEPYHVRSALCFPILKGKRVLGVSTLMHSQPGHFNTQPIVRFIEHLGSIVALVLDNVSLQLQLSEATTVPASPLQSSAPLSTKVSEVSPSPNDLTLTGIYIVTANGKFLYANPRFAEIFNYSLEELVALNSMFDLVDSQQETRLFEAIDRCFREHQKGFSSTFRGRSKYNDPITIEIEGNRTKFYGKPAIVGTVRLVP